MRAAPLQAPAAPRTEAEAAHLAYRPDIDGTRAVAVLAVLAFHAFPRAFPGGFVGVDVFFVISGFLISSIIFKSLARGTFSYADFYARRIRRIFPALTVVLVAVLAAGWFVLLPDEYSQLGQHTAAGAAFVSNLILWREAGYFDTVAELKPLLHLWSLGIEEQFYIVWPLLLALVWKRTRRIFAIVAAVALASFVLNVCLIRRSPITTFYLPFTRFWELLVGCLLAHLTLFSPRFAAIQAAERATVRSAMSVAVALLIGAAMVLLDPDRAFPGWWALLPTVGTALIIGAGPTAWINRQVLARRALVFVGLISYPLYLWHWPLLALLRVATPTPAVRLILVAVALSFVLAWATWRFVERPVRRRPGRVVVPLALGMLIIFCLGGALVFSKGLPARAVVQKHARVVADITSAVSKAEPVACAPDVRKRVPNLYYCKQARPGAPNALLLGDSHAQHFFYGLFPVDVSRNWLLVGHPQCPPTLGIALETNMPGCAEKMAEAIAYAASPAGPPLVVLSFFGSYAEETNLAFEHVAGRMGPAQFRLDGQKSRDAKGEALFKGLDATVERLLSAGKQVALMIDAPELPFMPAGCVERLGGETRKSCSIARADVIERQRLIRSIVRRLAARHPAMKVFDPLPILCPGDRCTPVTKDFSYYNDSHHVSRRGAEKLSRSLLRLLESPTP